MLTRIEISDLAEAYNKLNHLAVTFSPPSDDALTSILVASGSRGGSVSRRRGIGRGSGGGHGRFQYTYYGKIGHLKEKCWDKHGRPSAASLGRGVASKQEKNSLQNVYAAEIGPVNIVQFITDNAANYRATGDMLFQKYRTFYWSPCATHCVNLMLQDLSEMHDMKSTLDQCQETVVKQRTSLRQMFASEEWATYPHAHKRNASLVVDIIFNNEIWESCVKLLKVCIPLVKVLRLADSEDRPSIGWTGQFHQPLHATAYNLNPAIRFSPTFKKAREVMHGLLDCINVLVADSREQDVVHNELDLYDTCFRNMGQPIAVRARTTMRPARFAIKISARHAVLVDAKGTGVCSNISIAKKGIGSNIKG
ncbi:hypothetical protein EJ110_NYTH50431 [Nymphaea thermarum]|nr:hypothetical protein EJ110_NYTH50431 [Nymphaea thermarum]